MPQASLLPAIVATPPAILYHYINIYKYKYINTICEDILLVFILKRFLGLFRGSLCCLYCIDLFYRCLFIKKRKLKIQSVACSFRVRLSDRPAGCWPPGVGKGTVLRVAALVSLEGPPGELGWPAGVGVGTPDGPGHVQGSLLPAAAGQRRGGRCAVGERAWSRFPFRLSRALKGRAPLPGGEGLPCPGLLLALPSPGDATGARSRALGSASGQGLQELRSEGSFLLPFPGALQQS